MTINERIAYLKGLAAGISIDGREDGKLLVALIDTISDIAEEVESLGENALNIGEELDALSDDLSDVEEYLFDDDDSFDDEDFDDDDFDFDLNDEDDDDFGHCGKGGAFDGSPCCDFCNDGDSATAFSIDVKCPDCDAIIELNEDDIANESVTCSVCNSVIELDIDVVDFDGDDDNFDSNNDGNANPTTPDGAVS